MILDNTVHIFPRLILTHFYSSSHRHMKTIAELERENRALKRALTAANKSAAALAQSGFAVLLDAIQADESEFSTVSKKKIPQFLEQSPYKELQAAIGSESKRQGVGMVEIPNSPDEFQQLRNETMAIFSKV